MEYSLAEKIERAMVCLEAMKKFGLEDINESELANNWINAFWWAHLSDDIKKYGQIVLDYFEKAFNKDLIPKDQVPTLKYLMGEIHRRIGNKDNANKLFDKSISLTKKKRKLKWLYKLAVQQKTNPKANM